jgi:hypothetical protein
MEFYANFKGIPKIISKNFKIDRAIIPTIVSPLVFGALNQAIEYRPVQSTPKS